jgi:methylated-DNA-[protein]-cysteine S-methyltransferase
MTDAIPFFKTYYNSPIGGLLISSDEHAIRAIEFTDETNNRRTDGSVILDQCINELREYFEGSRKVFTVPVHAAGTEFQQKSWQLVCAVPFGRTQTYGEIAKRCGDIKLSRAVGLANGSNPIPIIIPCHRIIGQNGKLTGYGGGLWRKEWLLNHEARFSGRTELFF